MALLLALYAAVSLALALAAASSACGPSRAVARDADRVGLDLGGREPAHGRRHAGPSAWPRAPPRWPGPWPGWSWRRPPGDAWLRGLAGLTLVLPAVLWVPGCMRSACTCAPMRTGAARGWRTPWPACPITLIALAPAYTSVDPRLEAVVASLGRSRAALAVAHGWPLLRPAFAGAFAVGFAVSVAQYPPTLYVGGGRYATVTTEAVVLAAGGQRAPPPTRAR